MMASPNAAQVSVVVPHAGNLKHLQACLGTVIKEASVAEVIMVMPQGVPNSLGAADSVRGVRCLLTPRLLGYGAAANCGVAEASQPFVFVLNDDAWIIEGAVDALAAFMDRHPEVAACGAPLMFPDGRKQPSIFADVGVLSACEACLAPLLQGRLAHLRRHPRSGFPSSPMDVDWLSGAAILFRRSAFLAAGGFDDCFRHGLEDADLCRRLRGAGGRVVAVPGPAVVHVKGTSGYRSSDPENVKRALLGGLSGWRRYSRRYHGPVRRRLQKAALLGFIASRLAYFGFRSWAGRSELRPILAAYRAAGFQLLRDSW